MENASSVRVQVKPLAKAQGTSAKSGFWLVVLGAALWGVDPLFRLILLKSITSAQLVLLEHILIALVVAPILWKNRRELLGVGWKQVGALLFISWGGSAIATILFTMGLANGNVNAVLLLQKLQPLFAIIMARFLLKESLPRHFSLLFILALGGTYLLTFGFSIPFGHWNDFIQVGSLLSMGAAALWGGSTVMGRLMVGQMKYETVTSLRFILALPLLLVVTWNEGAAWHLPGSASGITAFSLNLLGQALLPGLLSLLVYYKGLTTTKASVATLAELSFPMVGVLLNWIAFQQIITLAQAVGFILIWAALFAISRQNNSSPA
ncbi:MULTISPECIES: DMT family transporter [Paenibacillus]|uniref:EamA family transporter n=1 Tax=Paenibacillus vini TaxID=1476024 RepID=A0ABQ4MD81_9BACL|nr:MULTISPECIES: DMT family transporter [Paenibacillus]MBQ4899136.1 DMT family transporter [Paenibacillus sp. Marseille-P2973]MDN4068659.1 DMT family transporter [Paenibacillus vini]GIP53957.1 EamA family transporter [Paenibacillus vini]